MRYYRCMLFPAINNAFQRTSAWTGAALCTCRSAWAWYVDITTPLKYFVAQAEDIYFDCVHVQVSHLLKQTDSDSTVVLLKKTFRNARAWLDRAPRKAAGMDAFAHWAYFVGMLVKNMEREKRAPVKIEDYARIAAYLDAVAKLPLDMLFIKAADRYVKLSGSRLTVPVYPIYEGLLDILQELSRGDQTTIAPNPILRALLVERFWDPTALMALLDKSREYRKSRDLARSQNPRDTENPLERLLREMIPVLWDSDWRPPVDEMYGRVWDVHRNSIWTLEEPEGLLHKIRVAMPEHGLHALDFIIRKQRALTAVGMPEIFPLFDGDLQEQNPGAIVGASLKILAVLAQEKANGEEPVFWELLHKHHFTWACAFDMHFMMFDSPVEAAAAKETLTKNINGLMAVTSEEILLEDDIADTSDLFAA